MIERKITDLKKSLKRIVAFGSIHSVDDSQKAQASFLSDETIDKIPLFQQYGFASRLPAGTSCVGVCSGNRENLVIVGARSSTTPKLHDGDVILFTNKGEEISLKSGHGIKVKAKSYSLQNAESGDELITVLTDLVEALENSAVSTALGPQPLSSRTRLSIIKDKIRRFSGGA